jgi:hypothetical protein
MDVDNETMIDTKFLKRFTDGSTAPFCPEILEVDEKLTNIPWLTVPVPRIEPDDWDLFWKLWNDFKFKSEKYNDIWDTICIWANPNLTDEQLKTEYPIMKRDRICDWSVHFPNMFKQINQAMPFLSIDKITIASNVKEVPLHIDAIKKFHPWPNAMRVMLWDTNEKPTFYLSKWQEEMYEAPIIKSNTPALNQLYYFQKIKNEDKIYIDLPKESNTFVYSNGEFLHGADLAKSKIILIIWGTPDPIKWKGRLYDIADHILNK